MEATRSLMPMSGTFFRADFVIKKISTAILPLLLIQEEQMSVTVKEWALNTGKLPRRPAQEQCGLGNWPCPKWPKMCWRAVKQKSNHDTRGFNNDKNKRFLDNDKWCLDKTWQQAHHDNYKRFLDNDKWYALIKHHDNRSVMTITRDQAIPWQWQVICLEKKNIMPTGASWQLQEIHCQWQVMFW